MPALPALATTSVPATRAAANNGSTTGITNSDGTASTDPLKLMFTTRCPANNARTLLIKALAMPKKKSGPPRSMARRRPEGRRSLPRALCASQTFDRIPDPRHDVPFTGDCPALTLAEGLF